MQWLQLSPNPLAGRSTWLGLVEFNSAMLGWAKSVLSAWAKSDGKGTAPAIGYFDFDKHPEDAFPVWSDRDGMMLHSFATWWNGSKDPKKSKLPVGTGSIAKVELQQAHVTALTEWALGKGFQAPPADAGPLQFPTAEAPPAEVVLTAVELCKKNCESIAFGPSKAACIIQCTTAAAAAATKPAGETRLPKGAPAGPGVPPPCDPGFFWDEATKLCQAVKVEITKKPAAAGPTSTTGVLIAVGGLLALGLLAAVFGARPTPARKLEELEENKHRARG